MTPQDRPERGSQLDAYLDGLLTGPEREAFERRIEGDAELRNEMARQRRIDASLARMFAPPAMNDLLARAEGNGAAGPVRAPVKPRRSGGWIPLAAAAAVAVAGASVWWYWDTLTSDQPGHGPVVQSRPLDEVYHKLVADGFHVDWECPPEQFRETFSYRMDQPMLLADASQDITPLGLAYRTSITPFTIVLLARVEGKPVVVFADRIAKDPGQNVPASSGLHLFKREVGKLALYEVTPLEAPRLLDLFYQPRPVSTQSTPTQ